LENSYTEREKRVTLPKIAKIWTDYIEGTKKSTRTPFKMVGANVKF